MSQLEVLDTVGTWVVLMSFWASFLFIPVVSTFWPWWRKPFSKSLMYLEMLVPMALLPGALRRMFGIPLTSLWFQWFEVSVVALITPAIIYRGIVTWRLQRQVPPGNDDTSPSGVTE